MCAKCGSEAHGECSNTIKCLNCKGAHSAFEKNCPCYQKEVEIIKIKINKNCTFKEARGLYEIEKPAGMANTIQQRIVQAQNIDANDKLIEQLTATIESLKKQVETLTEIVTKQAVPKKNS